MGKRKAKALAILVPALLVLLVVSSCPLMTLASLRQVDDHPLYVMRYYGPYTSDLLLRSGIEQSIYERIRRMAMPEACTCFAGMSADGEKIFGRNFDWYDHPALLVFTDPPDGYASVSMVDIYYLGYDAEGPSRIGRASLLLAPYLPFDGMNEAGVAVGMMAVPRAQDANDPQKPTIDSLRAIRELLDHAGSTDQAISLLQEYNISFSDPPIHYLISDSSGHSAIVEYVAGEMRVLIDDEPWQVSTNFIVSDVLPVGADSPCARYNKAYQALSAASGSISQREAMALLDSVSGPSTIWSAVYDLTTGDIRLVVGRDYDRTLEFHLQRDGTNPE